MSKKITRLPGDPPPHEDPARGRAIFALRPRRTLDTWERSAETGLVVICHPKTLRPTEVRLAKKLGRPLEVNRPLDEYGSEIWQLCDGSRTIEEIARAVEAKFHERFEPPLPRTLRFIEILARRGLVRMAPESGSAAEAKT